jgi:hypothetical protein
MSVNARNFKLVQALGDDDVDVKISGCAAGL